MFRIAKECHQIFNLLYIMIFDIHHFFLDKKSDSPTMYFHSSNAKGCVRGERCDSIGKCSMFQDEPSKVAPYHIYIHTIWVHPSINLLKN
jgi:hypothetical protein